MVNSSQLNEILEKLVNYLRREVGDVVYYEIRERKSKYEVYLKMDKNPMEISTMKLVFSKTGTKFRIFTGRVSLDLRLKRLVNRVVKRWLE
ncbi:MAG: hypothetical protein QW551_06940 [Desulfurococcaceae archaeon]